MVTEIRSRRRPSVGALRRGGLYVRIRGGAKGELDPQSANKVIAISQGVE